MKIEELKPGNYIQFWDYGNDKWLPYQVIGGAEIGWIEKGDSKARGIPLTKGWLDKFGFIGSVFKIKELGNNMELSFAIGGDIINCELISETLYDDTTERAIINLPIKHIHTLQNLYFALTGKELECK